MMNWAGNDEIEMEKLVVEEEEEDTGRGVYTKVMTDEQVQVLRKQIAVYSTICQQLVQMHRSQHPNLLSSDMRPGNMYYDPLMTSSGHKFNARQRWTPSPMQLQILEQIFAQGNGTPTKQKIKEITSELSEHGPLSETNVYNWFQNRRARSKRKQPAVAPNNPSQSEANTEVGSPNEKKTKTNDFQPEQNPTPQTDDACFQSFDLPSLQPHGDESDAVFGSTSNKSFDQLSFYENVMSSPSMYTL